MSDHGKRPDGIDHRRSGNARHILEAPGMFDAMLFLRSVGRCKKTDLFRGIGRRTGMAIKLDRLEDAGLVIQERYQGMTILFLTGEGRRVADMIERIREIIGGGELRTGRSLHRT